MAQRVKLDQLGEAVGKILDDYGDHVHAAVVEAVKVTVKAGAAEMKAASNSAFKDVGLPKGRYGSGWTSTTETGRLSAQGWIYNKKYPGLPHLLEYGHATKNGTGRVYPDTPGREHIKPVEEKVISEFEKGVLSRL